MTNSIETELQIIVKAVLEQSALLKIKGVEPGAGMDLIAYKISEHIIANFNIEKKNAWYGIDIEKKIKQLRQELAIAVVLWRVIPETAVIIVPGKSVCALRH